MCGEELSVRFLFAANTGSPPRVRGGDNHGVFLRGAQRITPACAGRSREIALPAALGQDHPRVCGEESTTRDLLDVGMGSPPRVRGGGDASGGYGYVQGITPACAGRSACQKDGYGAGEDHPRVCGEESSMISSMLPLEGSPPRVRGGVSPSPNATPTTGITPACAGRRVRFPSRPRSRWDHPRVCGEEPPRSPPISPAKGSPPRVRGGAS